MADGKAARCDACGHIFDRDERRYSDFWYDQSDEGRIVAVCGPCQGVFPPKSCPSCATLRAELATLRGKLRELDAWLHRGSIQLVNDKDVQSDAYAAMRRALGAKLRELGLVEARDGD